MSSSARTGIPGDYEGRSELKAAIAEVEAALEIFETAKTPENKEKVLAAVTKMEDIVKRLPQNGGRRRKTRGRKGRRGTRR